MASILETAYIIDKIHSVGKKHISPSMLSASQSLEDVAGKIVPMLRAVQKDNCRLLFPAALLRTLLMFGSSANSNSNLNLDSPALL